MIKGRDLISAKGYFQSNYGRWHTSGRPTTPDWVVAARCSQRGRSSPELCTTRLWCSIFGGFSSYGTGGVRGIHQGGVLPVGGSSVGRVAARFKLQPLVTVGGCSKGRLMTWLGKIGAAQDVEHRRRVDGPRGASHVAW
jgi:hypothetical protein